VKVSCSEGVAIHTGPESCAAAREGRGEALTGECIGQPLSRERTVYPDADTVHPVEGNTPRRVMRATGRSGVVGDPGMCRRFLRGNRETSCLAGRPMAAPARVGKARSRSRR